MRHMTFTRGTIALSTFVLLSGCYSMESQYRPRESADQPKTGYFETQRPDGTYELSVVAAVRSRSVAVSEPMELWERRAEELCGHDEYTMRIFHTYGAAGSDGLGSRVGSYVLNGLLNCDGDESALTRMTDASDTVEEHEDILPETDEADMDDLDEVEDTETDTSL
ncbi:hypothetical protein [Parvularcula marina]|uniref:Lipoprotein n=1 Tax=Parvularcula marina TaxID=2292771 RepID=A0A371R889_9PROT|nr:hypothetical protein [Parvularcula marina]RFB01677.1 hypothetical protein DX908_15510 [Parvularcula marina]